MHLVHDLLLHVLCRRRQIHLKGISTFLISIIRNVQYLCLHPGLHGLLLHGRLEKSLLFHRDRLRHVHRVRLQV